MIEVPESYVGAVMEKLGGRKAELINMGNQRYGTTHMEFKNSCPRIDEVIVKSS